MKKEMKWGLATLILLLGIAAVFIFLDKDTETEPRLVLGQATKKLLEEGPQQQSTPSPDGHGHDGEWHNKGHQSEPESPKALSKKEIAARYTKEEQKKNAIIGNLRGSTRHHLATSTTTMKTEYQNFMPKINSTLDSLDGLKDMGTQLYSVMKSWNVIKH